MVFTDTHPLTMAVRAALAGAANPKNAPQMQRYMKSSMLFRGVKKPEQRRIFRNLFKKILIESFQEYIYVIRQLWNAQYREERYAAISVARYYDAYQVTDALPLYRMMIETGAWWDYVDVIAAHLIGNLLRREPDVMMRELSEWIVDENIWVRRSAVLSQLRFKEHTDWDLLMRFCKSRLHEKEFWMRKSIGWALREYSKTAPDRVRDFVDMYRGEMSALTLREAEKYIY